MPKKLTTPAFTLVDLNEKFSSEVVCKNYLASLRWKDGAVCPYCKNTKSYAFKNGDYKCAKCRKHYTVRIGTIFEDSKISLKKWFITAYLITAHKKGISSHQLGRDLDVTQKTAWFMLHRLRYALKVKSFDTQLQGVVEMDETYIGGKESNKHKSKRVKGTQGRSSKTKTPVFGMIERGSRLVAMTVSDTKKDELQPIIREYVAISAKLMTDKWKAYVSLHRTYEHSVVHHGKGEYKNGDAHTNTIEGFWSLFKRGVNGIYHWISVKHMDTYVNEFQYRYNTRKVKDGERFQTVLGGISGRLTYKDLIAQD